MSGLGFKVAGLGLRVWGFRAWGLGLQTHQNLSAIRCKA